MKARALVSVVGVVLALAPIRARQSTTLRPVLAKPSDLSQFTLDGSGTWEVKDGLLVLAKAGTPAGAIRRPSALAILKSDPFLRVTVEAQIRSTAPVETHERDLEFIVGYQSPSRFYYVHLAGILNDVHNGIFLVADADRKRIDPGKTPAQLLDQAWHDARVVRDGSTGSIQVFMNGGKAPVMEANDKTWATGQVGVASFDDTGEFRRIVVTGSK
jgi:hypothetical protein